MTSFLINLKITRLNLIVHAIKAINLKISSISNFPLELFSKLET